jgi:hypothetical protein
MATIEDLFAALKAADQAGNVEDATKLARYISSLGYGPSIQKEPEAPPPSFMQRAKTALARGVEQLPESLAGITLGAEAGLGMKEAATKKLAEIKSDQQKPDARAPGITWEELEQTYGKEGAIEALKKLPTYAVEQILQNAPSMAAPLAVGAAATPFTGPFGGLAAGIGTYGVQQFGQFMQRQAQGAKTVEELEPGKAAATAAVTAPLGFFVDRLTVGMSRIPNKILGQEIGAELAKRAGVRAATGATIGVVAEAPTEVLEQMAERWQANLPLFTEDAIREYKEAAAGAAVVGGSIGATSRLMSPPLATQPPPPPQIAEPTPFAAAPEAAPVPEFIPQGRGFSAEEADALRRQAEEAELQRLQDLGERQRQEEEMRRQEMELTQRYMSRVPGMTGMPDANAAIMQAARSREAEEAALAQARQKAEQDEMERLRLGHIRQIQRTTFSPDPVQDQIVKSRLLSQYQQTSPAVNVNTPEQIEPPEFQPISAPQDKPKGVTLFKQTPGERAEIKSIDEALVNVNKEITKAKSEKSSLFKVLEGKLTERTGAFGLSDIDPDNKSLKRLYNKQGKGALLEDLVSDGLLDEFLPIRNRVLINGQENPNFDQSEALEYIAQKLRSKDYDSVEQSDNLRVLMEQKDRLKTEQERLKGIPDVNLELARRAGLPKRDIEPVSLADLEAEASQAGSDIEAIKEMAAISSANASPEQYQAAYRDALESSIRSRKVNITEELYQAEGDQSKGYSPTKEGLQIQKDITGKDFNGLIKWVVDSAPNRFQTLVAKKVQALANELQQRGVKMSFDVHGGSSRPSVMRNAAGRTSLTWGTDRTEIIIGFNGEPVMVNQNGFPSGMSHKTVQHELLHSVIRTATKFLPADHPVIKELRNLFNTVYAQYQKDEKAGTLPDVLLKFSKRMNNALKDPDELISWGMTDKDFQDYLSKINVGPKQTAFNKLVELIREIIGLPKAFESALEKLIRTTDSLLEMDVDVVGKAMQKQGYSYGKPVAKPIVKPIKAEKPKAQPIQGSLFARSDNIEKDDLFSRQQGFFFNAKESPLYQTRTAEEVGDFSQAEADKVVELNKRAKDIQDERRWVGKLKDGSWVGTRLDLATAAAARKRGMPTVLTIHEGSADKHTSGFYRGELLKFVPHITLRNVNFNIYQAQREKIAEGGEKNRMASADGQYVDTSPNFDGIEISFNPFREHLFRDAVGRAVKYADEITAVRGKIFARGNIEYYGAEDMPAVATAPSEAWIMSSGQDARQLQNRPAIIDNTGKVDKEQQKSLFNGQNVIQDDLFQREEGFFIDAKQSPLYQTRTQADVPVITQDLVNKALATHQKGARVEGKGIQLKPGDYIGSRLDLGIRGTSRTAGIMPGGVPVQAIHIGNQKNYEREDGGFWGGKIAKYLPSVTMKNVKFRVSQEEREEIAAGRKKAPMASADGQFVRSDNPNFDGIEMVFNPKREHLFTDALGRAIKYADEVTVMGDRMYARGHIEYYGDKDFVVPVGPSPSKAIPLSMQDAARQIAGKTGVLPQPIQDELFAQQGMTRRGFFGLSATKEAPAQGAFEKLLQTPVSRRTVLKSTIGRAIQSFVPNISSEFINLPDNFARVASTVDGYVFVQQPNGKWISPSLFEANDIEDLVKSFTNYDGVMLSFGVVPKAMLDKTGETINEIFYNSIEQSLQPTLDAAKYFAEHSFLGGYTGPTKTVNDLVKEANEYLKFSALPLKQQQKIERDKAFKEWFGDSKVVDENGKPLVVYHGTSKDIDFKKFKVPRNGAWFSPDTNVASMYAKENDSQDIRYEHTPTGSKYVHINTAARVMPVYLSIQNPYTLTKKDMDSFGDNYQKDQKVLFDRLRKEGYDGAHIEGKPGEYDDVWIVLDNPNQIKSVFNRGTYSKTSSDILLQQEGVLNRSKAGDDAMEILSGMGRFVEPPEPGYVAKARQAWDNARDNPTLAKEQSIGAARRFLDQMETWAFSSDAGLNNQIRRAVQESMIGQEEKIGILLNASLSQTVHSDAIANLFLSKGNIKWDDKLHKWVGVDDKSNIQNLSKQLDAIADKHGLTKEEIELIAHTAFEAKRTQSLIRENAAIEAQAEAMRAEAKRIREASPVAASELSEKASKLLQKQKVIHMTDEQIKAGMTQFNLFPELNEVVKTWDGIRENAIEVMVQTGLYNREEADALLANADYVPFFREDQIEEGKGPKEFLRSLSVQADKRMKGSMKPVNDIFDNMVRWTQYAVNRGVRNRSALALVDTAKDVGLGEKVAGPKDGENVVRVWRDGKEEYFSMADPMFIHAFRGLESVSIPTVKFFSKFADILRSSVVLFPVFSAAQVTQDSFAAMFSSGLKPQHALSIPFRAVKEFVQTLRGKSKAHEELKNVGAVGVRDFSSSVIRMETEILSGLKKDKSFWSGVKRRLGNIAMAADNAVRQATYEAALAQGMSRAEAIEKAFEIFNVRRRGSSQMLAMAGQVIPFFNAYLAAQNVAYRTLTGVGVSPTERKAAFQTLAATTASVMALSTLYAMMMGDDEDYEKKPTPTRDRLLMIPGTGGLGVPLRSDAFILPKVLAEHTYHLLTENGMTDPAKFRASLASLLANSVLSPTAVPQAVKPIVEVALNYDFFQKQPLVGIYQAKKDVSRQFDDSTSEFAKVLGSTELISPIVADHVIRGMFGSFGGAFLLATNPIIAAMAGTTRPSMSVNDAINAIPNASAFVSKDYEVGLRKDFYALKEVTDRAAATLSDLKQRSPQEIKEYLDDPTVRQRIGMAPVINRISTQLTNIRKQINLITNIEDPRFTSDRKEQEIKKLRDAEYQLLKNINLRQLREMAQM